MVSRELAQSPALDALAQAQVDIGKLETEVSHLRKDVAELKTMVQSLTANLAQVQTQLSEAKGGWRALMLMGGAASALGAAISWAIAHMRYTP